MTTAILLAILVAAIAIAIAVVCYKHGKAEEVKRKENEVVVMDWLEANTMLRNSAFESFKALFQAARRW